MIDAALMLATKDVLSASEFLATLGAVGTGGKSLTLSRAIGLRYDVRA